MTAQEFKAFRLKLGLKPGQLAKALKVQPETVSRWEHGSQRVSQKTVLKLIRLTDDQVCPTCGHLIT